MTNIAVFGAQDWEQKHIQEQLPDDSFSWFDDVLAPGKIPEEAKDAEILSVFVDSVVDASVIDSFSNLSCIATRSTGFDHIDIEHAEKKGITVSTVPFYGANTVAEHAFGLLLGLSKRICDGYEQLRERGDYDPSKLRGFDLKGKTLGILGTGNIGLHAIAIGNGFGMRVIGYDAFPKKELEGEYSFEYRDTLEAFLSESDIVSIHVPYLPQTHHLINKESIAHMKKGAVVINTSRGQIVETEALFDALVSGHLHGAGLDVVEEEGFIKDEMKLLTKEADEKHNLRVALMNHKLIDMPNVIMTPHSAFNTTEALTRILDTTIENIKGCKNNDPKNIVKPKV